MDQGQRRMIPTIEVRETEEKKWGLYVNGIIIGESKNRCDADFSVVVLKKALGVPNNDQEIPTESNNVSST